jgi:hypothetical protein
MTGFLIFLLLLALLLWSPPLRQLLGALVWDLRAAHQVALAELVARSSRTREPALSW